MKKLTAFLLIFVPGFLMSQSFSLEAIMSAPYASDLVSSPSGNSIAWVSNEKGQRILYTASLPTLNQVARFYSNGDDGQLITNISFSHDDQKVFFVVGSSPNRNGEIANPASLIPYPTRKLLSLDINTNSWDTIGNYGNYTISPNDDQLLIAQGKQLLSYDLASGKKETLLTMRGSFSNVNFNSDGSAIAFTSNRGDHSFIGVYNMGSDRIKWLGPGVDNDFAPQWSPDNSSLAWIRIPGLKKGELRNLTGGNPFKIMMGNIRSGEVTELWSSPSDDGGFAQYYPAHPIMWASTGNILFYSEHEGWMKIYDLDPNSKEIKVLMDGDCEIEHSSLGPYGMNLVFSNNCSDINNRDIAVYDLTSGQITQSVVSPSITTDPVLLADESIVLRKGGYNFVTNISRIEGDINQTLFPNGPSPGFPSDQMVQPENVTFTAEDGTTVHGQLFNSGSGSNKPALIFMHGGPIRQMLPGVHYSSYYANAYLMNQFLANQGYVVMSVNFRAGIGYGRDFRRADDQGPRGASEYQDILAGAQYLQSLDEVDDERVGLWGGSYGGLLTAQGLARNSDIFKAGVDFHGVHDWAWRATDFSPGGGWGITSDLMDQAYNSSPVAEVESWKSPVLLIHGDDDRNVMFDQTTDLVRRLREKGVYHEILVLPDEVHGFYRWQSWFDSYEATASFFDKFLKN